MEVHEVPYSRKEIPPITVKPKLPKLTSFSVPIDKLIINFPKRIEFQIPTDVEVSQGPYLRSFSSKPLECFILEHDGIKVFVFRSAIKTQIQLNPNQFDSFKGLKRWLKTFCKSHYFSHTIRKIHLFIDVPWTIEDIHKSLVINGPRKSKKFALTETRKFSGIESLSVTKKFGSEQYRQDAIYDSHRKHGLSYPSTRLESQFNSPRSLGVRWVDDIGEFLKLKPFDRYLIEELVDVHDFSPADKAKYEYLVLLIEKYGRQEAISRLRADCRGHFWEKYGRVLARAFKPVAVDFTPLFESRLNAFLEADISKREQTFIKLFEDSIATSKLH